MNFCTGGTETTKMLDPLELKLQAVLNCQTGVLEHELCSPRRAGGTLNLWDISPAPISLL